MTYKFAKTLLMGSLFSMGAFGLIACGDDGSSSPKGNEEKPIDVPTVQDQIILFNSLAATDLGGAGLGPIKITGSVTVNATDTLSSATPENIKITDIVFQVGKVNADGSLKTTGVQATVEFPPNYASGTIDNVTFTEANVQVNLADAALTECGEYKLIITAKASDGAKEFENTQTVSFNRSEEYCKAAPESSSGASEPAGGVVMTVCPEITMSTHMLPGLDLASCKASESTTADIVVVKSSGDFKITSGNGTLFSPIDNESMTPNNYKDDYYLGYWPEDVNGREALMSDFMYKQISGTAIDKFNEEHAQEIFVAKTAAFNEATGAGFFAFAVTKATRGNNDDYTLTLKVYKAK